MFESLKNRIPGDIDEGRYRQYAVAVPVVQKDGEPYILFEVRAQDLKRQPGEICFPGGGREGDESAVDNAVRETCEELCLKREQVDVICQMDTYYNMADIEISVFMVELKDYDMSFSSDEVDRVFLVPLRYFMETDPEAYESRYMPVLGDDFPYDKIQGGKDYPWHGPKRKIYFYEYENDVIWGMTAYIMQGVAKVLRREWQPNQA